ncbi:MAG: outer membrane lipoprotein-sorting protein [Nevskiales bacterium]
MKRFAMLLALLVLTPAYADDAAQKVADCMRANFPPSIRIQALELSTINQAGDTRSMKGRVFVLREDEGKDKGLLRTMLKIDAPSNLKGAAYLVRETDDFLRDGMFVYLPAVNRVRRVTGEFADGSLMGTDFSYYDFKQLQGAFGDLSGKLESSDQIEGRAVQVLSFQPLPNVDSPYTSVKVWVDQQTCVPLRADFNEGDKVLKRLSASPKALQQSGKFWYLAELEMKNLGKGTRSVLKLGEVTSGSELSNVYFNPSSFYLGN